MRNLVQILIVLVSAFTFAQTGNIQGVIQDKEYAGNPLPFADVYLKGTDKGATTDFDGNYSIENIEPGTYILVISFVGYETKEIADVIIKADQTITLNSELGADAAALKEVIVEGTSAVQESEKALLVEQKKAVVVKESIGVEQIKKLAVSDAAGATAKISGVTKNESSGDLSTTLNGLPIPSDDVEKKNIALKLFPTSVIQNIGISKTYGSDKYGDQASGNVDIKLREHSGSKPKYSISVNSGANSNAISGPFRRTQNKNNTTLGFFNSDITNREALTQQSFNSTSENNPVNFGISASAGGKIANKVSVFGSVSHSVSHNDQRGEFRQFESNFLRDSINDLTTFKTKVVTSALFNASAKYAQGQKIKFTALYINNLTDELNELGRDGTGFIFEEVDNTGNTSQFIRDQNTKQTQLFIAQLTGSNRFSDLDKLDWGIGGNIVEADEPSRLRNELNIFGENDIRFGFQGPIQQRISSQEIKDEEINARINYEHKFWDDLDDKSISLNIGGNGRIKERIFDSSIESLILENNSFSINSIDNLDEGLNIANVQNGTFSINQNPQIEFYDAELNVYAGYINSDFSFGDFSGNVGLRYEVDEINLPIFNVFNFNQNEDTFLFTDYENILPSLNLKYAFNEDKMAVRFAGSQTITLPEFKELAPFAYTPPSGRQIVGNPELIASETLNFDLKYEFFPRSGELISASVFHKIIEDPINKAFERGAAQRLSFFNTSDEATITGLELEAKLDLIDVEDVAKLSTLFNVTRLWHNQELKAADPENGQNNEFRFGDTTEIGLEGASDWIINGAFTYSNNREKEFSATLSGNYSSDKINALGTADSPTQFTTLFSNEIIEEGFVTLDLILSKKITEKLTLKATALNLLDPTIRQTQVIDNVDSLTGNVLGSEKATVLSYRKGNTYKVFLMIFKIINK